MSYFRKAGLALLVAAVGVQGLYIQHQHPASHALDLEGGASEFDSLYVPTPANSDDYLWPREALASRVDSVPGEHLYRRAVIQREIRRRANRAALEVLLQRRGTPAAADSIPSVHKLLRFFAKTKKDPQQVLFWSGMKDTTAMDIAKKMGKVTLEMMVKPEDKPLPQFETVVNGPNAKKFWDNASEAFAKFARGIVSVVLSPERDAKLQSGDKSSTWARVEMPNLLKKAKHAIKGVMKYIGTGPNDVKKVGPYKGF